MKIKQWRGAISGAIIGLVLSIIGLTVYEWQFWVSAIIIATLIEVNVAIKKLDK